MKTFKVYITVRQELAMQVEAEDTEQALERARTLTDNGTYATENDNCYDSDIIVDQAEEILESNDIDDQVVEDNKNYLSDIEN